MTTHSRGFAGSSHTKTRINRGCRSVSANPLCKTTAAEHGELENIGARRGGLNKAAAKFAIYCRFCLAECKTDSKKKGVEGKIGKEDGPCSVLLMNAVQRKVQKCGSTQVSTGHVKQQ